MYVPRKFTINDGAEEETETSIVLLCKCQIIEHDGRDTSGPFSLGAKVKHFTRLCSNDANE